MREQFLAAIDQARRFAEQPSSLQPAAVTRGLDLIAETPISARWKALEWAVVSLAGFGEEGRGGEINVALYFAPPQDAPDAVPYVGLTWQTPTPPAASVEVRLEEGDDWSEAADQLGSRLKFLEHDGQATSCTVHFEGW